MYALVTGASSGIGLQYATVLAEKYKRDLVLVSNQEKELQEAAKEISEKYGVKTVTLFKDLSTETAPQEVYDFCKENNLEIEILINNAGVFYFNDLCKTAEARINLMLHLHIRTVTQMCRLFGMDMRERGKGYILNMCSITADIAVQRLGSYGSTKAFLRNFTRALHVEMKDKGVIITDMTPGAINTGLYNIKPWATKLGLILGYIVQPDYLARRGVRAMMRGRAKVSVPFVWNYLLIWLVVLFVPTCLLRLIRKMGLF